jgi:CubicO group peptidase (beta-lactamase class C family)
MAGRRRGPGTVEGDPELAGRLRLLVGRRARRVGVAIVDVRANPVIRSAFLNADRGACFEIGSVTKGLTGMLLADAVGRREVELEDTVGSNLTEIEEQQRIALDLLQSV